MPGTAPPASLQPVYDSIPGRLRRECAWVIWRWELVRGRWSKVPYQARSHRQKARSDDPSTWRSYERAFTSWTEKQGDGIGLMRSGRRLFVDLDGCLDEHGGWREWKFPGPVPEAIVAALSRWAWAELSPSGRGVHLIADAGLPPGPRQFDFADHTGVAFYDGPRFFALTGRTLFASAPEPEAVPGEVIGRIWRAFLATRKKTAARRPQPVPVRPRADFERLLNFPEMAALWRGDWENGYGSRSEADLAFLSKLARHGFSLEEAEHLYTLSGLMRDKWLRASYAQRTLEKAFRR